MASYIDEYGQPIDLDTWIILCRTGGIGRILAEQIVSTADGDLTIRTFWFGTVYPEVNVRPFATAQALTGTDYWSELEQYDTKDDAMAGHRRWVHARSFPQPTTDTRR